MEKYVRLGLAQINTTVGALESNKRKIKEFMEDAYKKGTDILLFPELSTTGYPPEDLLLNPNFVEGNLEVLKEIAACSKDMVTIVGFVDRVGSKIFNSSAIIYRGSILGVYHKEILPNYGVFDEKRYFASGNIPMLCRFGPLTFGVTICEDIWIPKTPLKKEAMAGAQLILSINASPFYSGKVKLREQLLKELCIKNKVYIPYLNLVGGQDELVFDGNSMVLDSNGNIIAKAPAFKECLLLVDINLEDLPKKEHLLSSRKRCQEVIIDEEFHFTKETKIVDYYPLDYLDSVEEVYEALILGLSDYVRKNGFEKVVLGLSGGIDSSLVATIACDALGKDAVKGVFMPSCYTSVESREDAFELARNLGIEVLTVPIDGIYQCYLNTLEPIFSGLQQDETEENIQARIRGNILMALSNKFGWLVLTTGNKSEMSVGYATLYGDMAGGFAVIKDVPKTLVYELARFRNRKGMVIPGRVLIKEPSAELRPGQKDTDSLPPYEILDVMIKAYVEEDKGMEEIVNQIGNHELVKKVLDMIDKNEYKRRQAPPGIKITPKAFGKDRRMPITNGFRAGQ